MFPRGKAWQSHVQEKVYADRLNKSFANEAELKEKIRKVWPEVVGDLHGIQKALKQFTSRLKAVHGSINGDLLKCFLARFFNFCHLCNCILYFSIESFWKN